MKTLIKFIKRIFNYKELKILWWNMRSKKLMNDYVYFCCMTMREKDDKKIKEYEEKRDLTEKKQDQIIEKRNAYAFKNFLKPHPNCDIDWRKNYVKNNLDKFENLEWKKKWELGLREDDHEWRKNKKMTRSYKIDENGDAVAIDSMINFEFDKFRSIAFTKINEEECLSTAFLSLDHSFRGDKPMIFESMWFGGKNDGEQRRYSTKKEALFGIDFHLKRIL